MQLDATTHFTERARLVLDTSLAHHAATDLRSDALEGLAGRPKRLPPKYFYDDVGSRLFDAICDTPEYYPTRTEAALLEAVADPVMQAVRPTHLVELGSGAARKTRMLLEAMHRVRGRGTYVPLDVSEGMLRESAALLLDDYPWLSVHGLVGDYFHTLARVPAGQRRLVAFLGGTIGNLEAPEAEAFLGQVRAQLHPGDALLLGTDLVKEKDTLDAAYNDAQGLTAAFNKNLLAVLNRELGSTFDPDDFDHLAFFDRDKAQVEMHLRARRPLRVRLPAIHLEVRFEAGETLHTEISRKFTRDSVAAMLARAGLELSEWYVPDDEAFALSLARPR